MRAKLMSKFWWLASSLLLVSLGARADNVGNVGAVNQSARGAPPGGASRALSVGLGVQNRERIETSAEGSAQIVFLDASTVTIGRNSAVTIDDFLYKPNAGAESQSVTVAKGVMRFVGGGVSHGQGARLKTPSASIGLRGGTAIIDANLRDFRPPNGGACGALVLLQFGVAEVSNGGGSAFLTRPGYAVCAPMGGPVGEPFLAPPELVAALTKRLASAPGQQGGVVAPPTNLAASKGLGVNRPPNDVQGPGLDVLNQQWGGNALVQSRANANNQPAAPPAQRQEHPGEEYPGEGYSGEGYTGGDYYMVGDGAAPVSAPTGPPTGFGQ